MPRNVIDSEEERLKNEGRIQRESEDRISKLARSLESEPIDFDMSNESDEPDVQLRKFKGAAHKTLKAILAKAAADEAALHGDD